MKVKSALKGGAGEKAGINAGDILVSMDGVKLSDLKSTTARMSEAPIGEDVKFVVRRAGQERDDHGQGRVRGRRAAVGAMLITEGHVGLAVSPSRHLLDLPRLI